MSEPPVFLGPTSSRGFSFEDKEIVLRLRSELSLGLGLGAIWDGPAQELGNALCLRKIQM